MSSCMQASAAATCSVAIAARHSCLHLSKCTFLQACILTLLSGAFAPDLMSWLSNHALTPALRRVRLAATSNLWGYVQERWIWFNDMRGSYFNGERDNGSLGHGRVSTCASQLKSPL